jgi:hypothetical protein
MSTATTMPTAGRVKSATQPTPELPSEAMDFSGTKKKISTRLAMCSVDLCGGANQ